MKKEMIRIDINLDINHWDLDGIEVSKIQQTIQAKIDRHLDGNRLPALANKKWEKFTLDVSYGYEGSDNFRVYGYRYRTEEEEKDLAEAKRKASIAAKKAATTRKNNKEKEEREVYEALKKKFETKK